MGTVSERTWSDLLASLRAQSPELLRPWFRHLTPSGLTNGVIQVGTSDITQYEYLTQHCKAAFTEAAQRVTGHLVTVHFEPPAQRTAVESPLSFEIETEKPRLKPDATFEDFVTGDSNRLAHAAAIAVSENPGQVYNPLFIHGNVGLGKTHLLQAACHRILQTNPDARVLYLSCETFTNHYVEAIERGAMHRFRERYRNVEALAIDDIQFLTSREGTREEFFHTFNSLFQTQTQIILSADEAPRGIPSLEDRLVSRFSWGLVARIESPSIETRMAILRKKARQRCIDMPEDVIHFVAAHARSSIRELEGSLTKILALSQQYGGVIDLRIAREAVGDVDSTTPRAPTVSDIIELITQRFNVRLGDLQGKRRSRSVAHPRQISMYLARELTNLSLEEIGGYFGGRDHTTVLHAVRAIQALVDTDESFQITIRELIDELRSRG